MHGVYQFITGPLAWLAFVLFFGGCLYRVFNLLYTVNKTEKFIFSYKYSNKSDFGQAQL